MTKEELAHLCDLQTQALSGLEAGLNTCQKANVHLEDLLRRSRGAVRECYTRARGEHRPDYLQLGNLLGAIDRVLGIEWLDDAEPMKQPEDWNEKEDDA